MTDHRLPTDAGDLSLEELNAALAETSPGMALTHFEVTESHLWGGGAASSAGRLVIAPSYASPSGELPRRLVVKVAKTDPNSDDPKRVRGTFALYRNEVDIYARLRPSSFLEAARVFGGAYHPPTSTFLLLMEDLRDRGASFGAATQPVSLETMRSLLAQLAILHARFWNSAALTTTLSWMEAHTRGDLHQVFNTPQAAPRHIAEQIETVQFKREMVQRLGLTADALYAAFQRLQRHQATLAQTVCHGDAHIGNTYQLPDGRGGLLDWQLASQGYAMHDVSYLIATGLSIEQRRRHERDLIGYYREQLLEQGVTAAPGLDALWLEHRRAIVWGLYIGWLTTPVVNYGWEINVMNHLRLATAFEDLETGRALEPLP